MSLDELKTMVARAFNIYGENFPGAKLTFNHLQKYTNFDGAEVVKIVFTVFDDIPGEIVLLCDGLFVPCIYKGLMAGVCDAIASYREHELCVKEYATVVRIRATNEKIPG